MKFKFFLPLSLVLMSFLFFSSHVNGKILQNHPFIKTNQFLGNYIFNPTTSCTVFTVEFNNSVYFGNNEDEGGSRRNTRIWFTPALDNSTYGCAYLGFYDNLPGGDDVDNLAIGGINSKGLCFDANGIPVKLVASNTIGRPRSGINDWEWILRECASVEEVIQWHLTHNMGGYWGNQVHWADGTGDAVVIGPGNNRQLVFTRKISDYLISTNFNLANYNLSDPYIYYPCSRYKGVKNLLDLYLVEKNLTIYHLRDILESVHFPGTSEYVGTVYSNIFELQSKEIYLYILGDYSKVYKLNLDEELEKGEHELRITMEGDFSSKSAIGFDSLLTIICLILLVRYSKPK